jgi:hypothetical protein
MDQPNGLAISLEWIDLSELPDDLKVNILTRDSEHYSKLPHISKGVNNASKLQRLRNACLKPISNDELDQYKMGYQPPLICQMAYNKLGADEYYVGIFMGLESKTEMPYSYASSYLYGRFYEDESSYVGITHQVESEDNIINYSLKIDTDDEIPNITYRCHCL